MSSDAWSILEYNMNGQIFNIQRFSLNDGPGIRTTVFCCGCTLQCRWCHNPEGRSPTPPLQYLNSKCIHCRACEAVCPRHAHHFDCKTHTVDFSACIACGKCVAVCPANALRSVATSYTPEQLAEEVARDIPFFKSNGGVTFSGGEPLMQAKFIAESAKQMKEKGVPSVAIDTAGNVEWDAFEKVLDITDLFLFDIKSLDNELHREGTGYGNTLILENLKRLESSGANIHIRIPIIGGFNDSDTQMQAIANFVSTFQNAHQVTLIPFHKLGNEKYASVGLISQMENFHEISETELKRWNSFFQHFEKETHRKESIK
ncbi:MAG: glycyl-radical enzyme activating protein [Clostridia bacterium]|nr:glycyl-radical enzyme activating protein [Clostridia bacterium]